MSGRLIRSGRALRRGAAALLLALALAHPASTHAADDASGSGNSAADEAHGEGFDHARDDARKVREAGEAAVAGGKIAPDVAPDDAAAEHSTSDDEAPADADADAPKAWPTTRAPQPYEIVRSLQFLQDQVARGNGPAIRVQAMLLRRYGPTFRDADVATWRDPRNIRAAALFVLSGGPPSVLKAILAKAEPAGDEATLLRGALAYVENRTEVAERLLGQLDTRFMEASLAAQLDLAIAQIEQANEPEEALARLRKVMLAAPGTLLDEAALRMGVVLAETTGRPQEADLFARQYFDRYGASAYAGNFRARLASIYAARPADVVPQTIDAIADATHAIPGDQQRAIFLAVSRRALVGGGLRLAAEAALKVSAGKDVPPVDRQRALLYETAATLADLKPVEARTRLEALDPALLHPADARLRDAAFEVLDGMRQPLLAEAVPVDAGTPQGTVPQPPSATLQRGKALLEAISEDLGNDTP